MVSLEPGGSDLAAIHKLSNDKKYYCYFTGFLEGVAASGNIEVGELEPLLTQCVEFVENLDEADAREILEDFRADLLDFDSILDIAEYRAREIDRSCPKSSTNRFLGFVAAIACDDIITEKEAVAVVGLAEENGAILEDPFARNVVNLCKEALDDGIVEPSESAEICAGISRLVGDAYCDTGISSLGGTPDFTTASIGGDPAALEGKRFVLTGSFSISPRRIIEERLREYGAETTKSVSKKVDYIVIAEDASRDWVHTHKGTKIIKAMNLRDSHGRPDFVSERELLALVGLK